MLIFASMVFIVIAYLIGAIPFGYCFAMWVKGVDIRTVGSGNIGATNVGRTFGLRYFWLIFLVDLAKGLLPTWAFPILFTKIIGQPAPADLAVLIALASIIGHNYPVYLGFKGGKGVATSLGALLALDPGASASAAASFVVFLVVSRYVSLSSLMGGIIFVLVHFVYVEHPLARDQIAMTMLTSALLILLFVRHRTNIVRIAARTEHKITFRRERRRQEPSGRILIRSLIALVVISVIATFALSLWKQAQHREVLTIGRTTIAESDRVATGHQRAERVAFADSGRLLVVTCPRYEHLVFYKVTVDNRLVLFRDIELAGKPMAVTTTKDRLYVLERPPGDQRHIEPGWIESYDFEGNAKGNRTLIGFYPDDMVLSPDGQRALVLTSGRAEGGPNRPRASLCVYRRFHDGFRAVDNGRLEFDDPRDDPFRITLSQSGRAAVVSMAGSEMNVAIDLNDPIHPMAIDRTLVSRMPLPYVSRSANDSIVMPVLTKNDAIRFPLENHDDVLACALPAESGIEFVLESPRKRQSLGKFLLRSGTWNLGKVRPIALAYAPERHLIAVANRSGSVHLVSLSERSKMTGLKTDQGTLKR